MSANQIYITAPHTGDNGNVLRAGDPGPALPVICHVEGTFDYSPDYQLDGIKLLSIKNLVGEPYASSEAEVEAVMSSCDSVDVPLENINLEQGTWFIDGAVPASIDNDPNATQNHLSAVALISVINAGAPLPIPEQQLAHRNFNAVPVDACQERDALQGLKQKPAQTKTPTLPMLNALDVSDGWIRYSFFSRSNQGIPLPPANGFVLAMPGCSQTPLTAREIAVATCQVDWRPHPGRHAVICRPLGILDTSLFDGSSSRRMQFDGLPKFSFVVHQLRTGPHAPIRVPVDSSCRDNPMRIRLDPAKPIYVHVNNVQDDRTKADGILTFWVKVLC